MLRAACRNSMLLLALLPFAVAHAQDAAVEVRLQREEIYVGESVSYEVFLNGFENDAVPEIPDSDAFTLKLVSNTVTSFMSTTTIQGRTRTVRRGGPRLTYELTPSTTGVIEIPAPVATANGKAIRGKAVTLTVIAPEEQDLVRLRVTHDPAHVYPTQPFRVRLEMDIRGLPDIASGQDPLTVQTLPTLTIPWTDDEDLPAGLVAARPRDSWLKELVAEDGRGVSINGLRGRRDIFSLDMGSLFGGRRRDDRIPFRPRPTKHMAEDATGTQVEYWRYIFEREFSAEQAGSFRFGAASVKGTFARGLNAGRSLEGETVYAIAEPVSVEVRDPPLAGRPDGFIGAIGQFEVGAQIAPSSAKVGDPMTLSIWIRGSGSLASVAAPRLQANDEVTGRFKVYDATQDQQGDTQSFTYSLRPLDADVEEFPEVAMAYFDPVAEKYVTARTPALPVAIEAAEQLNQRDIAMAGTPLPAADGLQASDGGIFANITDLSQLKNESVNPDHWFLGLGSMAGFFLLFVVVTRRLESRAGNIIQSRRRQAAGRARSLLQEASRAAKADDASAVADRLGRAFLGLIADVDDVSKNSSDAAVSVTTGDAITTLEGFGVDSALVDRCRQILEQCDAMRYGSASGQLGDFVQQAHSAADDLISTLRRQKRLP